MTSTAHTVTCDGCGGKIALTATSVRGSGPDAQLRCPYCGVHQVLDEAKRRELLRYEADVAGALARAGEERARIASWELWYGGRGGRSPNATKVSLAIFGVMFAVVIALGFVAQAMLMSGNPALVPIGTLLMPIATPVLFFGAIIGQIVWYYGGQRRQRAEATPPRANAKCPRCGATNVMAAGRTVERCTHCGASLLPTTTMMHAGRDAAEAERFRVELERHRIERRGIVQALSSSMGNVVPYIILGSWLPITVLPTIGFTVESISSGKTEPGLAILWGIAGLNVALIVLVASWRRGRRERFQWILAHATAPFVHRDVADGRGVAAWLDAHWAAGVDYPVLGAGPYFAASAITAGEYAGLVVLNPVGIGRGWDGHVSVFLSAWGMDPARVSPQLRADLGALGFHLQVERTGARASGREETAKSLAKLPNGGALVAHVVSLLVDAAHAQGARPITLATD